MKKIIYTAFALTLLAVGCKEEPPKITYKTGGSATDFDTTYISNTIPAAQSHVVMIEDFTGVRCPNCPSAHEETTDIINANPGRVVTVSLHPAGSNLAIPHDNSPDFRLEEAKDIANNMGGYVGLPAGGIDRQFLNGQTYLLISNYSLWSGVVNSRLSFLTPYNLTVNNVYDDATRELTTTMTVTLTAATTDTIAITAMITESKIIAMQENPMREIDTFYVHNHLVRKFITPALGKSLVMPTKVPGRVYQYITKRKLDTAWKPENCTVVAYVHSTGDKKDVYQAAEKAVK